MIFHHRNVKLPSNISLKINSIEIERVDNFNFLGITINKSLSWKPHIDNIAKKVPKFNGVLNRLKHILPENVFRTLYCSLIQSHLNYGILIWGFESIRLDKLQKKSMRVISNSKYNAHTEPLFKYLEILKLSDLFYVNILKFYYRLVNNKLPAYFSNFVNTSNHGYATRNNNRILSNVTRTHAAQKCIRNHLPIIINNCDPLIIAKVNTHSYKGFTNYAKISKIKGYNAQCTTLDCYICNSR